jgi:hypothetical protein
LCLSYVDEVEVVAQGRLLQYRSPILSIFERAVELGAAHPGFLMIDSPQKNLGSGNADEAEFQDARIVSGFYSHLHEWLDGLGRGAQIIVVDNAPPAAAEQDVIVRYTRDSQRAPYGAH